MAFTHLLPGTYLLYLNNRGEVTAQIGYDNDPGATQVWIGPNGNVVPTPALAVAAPTVQNYTLYANGNLKQLETLRSDGSGSVLNFADTNLVSFAFGPGSGLNGPGGIYEHGPLISSVETSASGYTITQSFLQNHLADYRFDYNNLHIVADYDIGTDTYSISVQNSVHTTPLVATGGGNIDPFVKVISNDGSSLISQDGAGLISQDGAGFSVRTIYNGTSIISDHASGLNLLNVAALISQDGAGLISQDGAGLISQDGAGITAGSRIVDINGFTVATLNSDLAGNEGLEFIASLTAHVGRGLSRYAGQDTFTSGPADDNTDFRIAVGATRVDKIDFLGDVDLWSITNDAGNAERQLIAGQTYLIDLKGSSSSSGTLVDPFLRIYAADKTTVVAETDDGGAGFNSRILFTPTTTGLYYIEAGARDDGSSGTYTLTVQDPSPVINSNGGGDTAGILIPENTDIVTTVTADDPDSGTTLQYSIVGGADAGKFGINATNGILYFLIPPNFELPNDADHNNSYLVEVQASDGTFVDRQLLTVSVTDVNEGTAVPEIAVWGNHTDITDGDTSPSAADFTAFGTVLAGSVMERSFAVINQGSAPLIISKIAVPKGFSIVESLNGTIAPGGFDFFTVRMDTSRVGTKSGTIVITSNDQSERTFDFAINGNVVAANPEIAVSGNTINIADGDRIPDSSDGTAFGTVVVGGHLDRTFTVTNSGSDPLSISSLTLTSGLTLVGPQPSTVAPGESATFTVRLTPTRVGTFRGTVTINNNDANEAAFDFAVSANVVAAPTPEIEVSGNGTDIRDNDRVPDTYDHTDFGLSSFGSPGVIRTFTIHNSGLAPLNISQVQLPTGFHLATAAPTTIAAGALAALAVQIDTNATGSRSGTVNILSNDSDEATFNFNIAGFVGPQQRTGDGGPNVFAAGAHAEAFFGLGDIDTVSYATATGPVVANLGAPARNTGFAAGDTYDSIESLTGSNYADTLTGNTAGNVLEGGLGADKLDGGSTDASDIDLASYRNAATGVTADLLRSRNNTGEAAGDTYKNIEGLLGSDHNDRLIGNTGRNFINGFDGDDTIVGNAGEDVLTGSTGADTFVFNTPTDGGGATVVIGVNPQPIGDLIFDFVTGEDHIGILRSGFKLAAALSSVDFAAHYFVSDPGVAPSQGNQAGISATEGGHGQFLFNESTAQLWWDADGTGTRSTPMLLASFASGGHPVAGDFLLM